ncbi:MAG TPA: substrate-binding domain-containing protein [Pseudobdellovibrionaceae bacterium]|jgi:DNA-binding transcriptional LysR family regulator
MSSKIKFNGTIFFLERSNEEIIESLLDLDLEVGVIHRIPPNTQELIAKPLFKEEFQLVIPKSFLSSRHVFGDALFYQLKRLPCLGYRPHDEVLRTVCSFTSTDMQTLKMMRATENYLSIVEMVEAKMGWAVLPTYLNVSEAKNWIVTIPARAFPARQFYLVYRQEFSSVPWFKDLISEIRSCFTPHWCG